MKEIMHVETGKNVGYWLNAILNKVVNEDLKNSREHIVQWMIEMKNAGLVSEHRSKGA